MIFPRCSTGVVEILNHWQENKMFIQNLDVLRILRIHQYLGFLSHIWMLHIFSFPLANSAISYILCDQSKYSGFYFANPLHIMQMFWRRNTKFWKTSSHFYVLFPIFKLYFANLKLLMSYLWLLFSLDPCWSCSKDLRSLLPTIYTDWGKSRFTDVPMGNNIIVNL